MKCHRLVLRFTASTSSVANSHTDDCDVANSHTDDCDVAKSHTDDCVVAKSPTDDCGAVGKKKEKKKPSSPCSCSFFLF